MSISSLIGMQAHKHKRSITWVIGIVHRLMPFAMRDMEYGIKVILYLSKVEDFLWFQAVLLLSVQSCDFFAEVIDLGAPRRDGLRRRQHFLVWYEALSLMYRLIPQFIQKRKSWRINRWFLNREFFYLPLTPTGKSHPVGVSGQIKEFSIASTERCRTRAWCIGIPSGILWLIAQERNDQNWFSDQLLPQKWGNCIQIQ